MENINLLTLIEYLYIMGIYGEVGFGVNEDVR
jgi:hypothetical protein